MSKDDEKQKTLRIFLTDPQPKDNFKRKLLKSRSRSKVELEANSLMFSKSVLYI